MGYTLQRYYRRRREAQDFLGNKCFKCGAETGLLFTRRAEGEQSLLRRRWSGSEERFREELELSALICERCQGKRLAKLKPPMRHGTHYSINRKKCRCDVCLARREELNARRRVANLGPVA